MSKRVKKQATPGADYDRDTATALAAEIVASQIQRERMVAERDAKIEAVKAPYRLEIDRIDAEIGDGLARMEAWSNANRADFGDAKSLVLPGGMRVGWRLGNWSAKTLRGWTWAKVQEAIEALPKAWRDSYLRTKTEVAKDAIISDREKVEWETLGVKFEQAETFYLEPHREEGGRIA
jgi:phage host-nuclease inhibitor protein Gam